MGASRIPFRRVREAFDEEVVRARDCQSSGSEHSAWGSSPLELSDLVNSFIERDHSDDDGGGGGDGQVSQVDDEVEHTDGLTEPDSDEVSLLRSFLGSLAEDESVKGMIRGVVRGEMNSEDGQEGSKRKWMSRLRQKGFNAGLCKTRLKKTSQGKIPSGDHEYIDVMVDGIRYIVEINLAKEFTIARPSNHYQQLLQELPTIFVGEVDELKQVVKLMCNAARKSMKSNEMHVPPWRKNRFLLAKWFGSYKRTTNSATKNVHVYGEGSAGKRSVGFEMPATSFHYCKDDLSRKKISVRVGNLSRVLDGN